MRFVFQREIPVAYVGPVQRSSLSLPRQPVVHPDVLPNVHPDVRTIQKVHI